VFFLESTTFYFQTTRGFILVDFFRPGGREVAIITLSHVGTYGATTKPSLAVVFLFELFVPFPILAKNEQLFEADFQVKATFFRFTSLLLVSRYHAF
jgi:hypothetical protein